MQKSFLVKIYDSDGSTFVATVNPEDVKKTPQFTSQINGIFGQCVIDLNMPFDDIESYIAHMNVVQIYEYDSDNNPDGILIYTGYMSKYTPYIKGADQGVTVTLLSLGTLLNYVFFRTGAGGFTVAYSADDPADIMKDIIDYFDLYYTGLITYDVGGTTIDTVGNTPDIEFVNLKCWEALNNTLPAAAGGWWWAINKAGVLYLKPKPSSATHIFTIGKDIDEFSAEHSNEDVINYVKFEYDTGDVTDTDSGSATTYGYRQKRIADSNIKNAATANWYAQKHVDDNKEEKVKAKLIINSDYNIESINVGDTCMIQNFKQGAGVFNDNMQIAAITYRFDQAILKLDEYSGFGIELNKLINS